MKRLIFLLITLISANVQADTISIQDALNKNLIVLTVKSLGGHTGQCIIFTAQNKTSDNLLLRIEAGRFMMPSDSTRQRMIITRERIMALLPMASDTAKSYAMCTQMYKAGPSLKTIFSLGKMAEGNLLKLVELINKNNYQTMAAQSAIWTVADNNDITDVYSDDKGEMVILRKFVSEVKTKQVPPKNFSDNIGFFKTKTDIDDSTYLKYSNGKIEGSIQFELTEDVSLYLTLYSENGTLVKSCFQNKLYKKGTNTIQYEFFYASTPRGNYHLKLYDSKGNILADKFITVKAGFYSF
jgi:hypothetical protein